MKPSECCRRDAEALVLFQHALAALADKTWMSSTVETSPTTNAELQRLRAEVAQAAGAAQRWGGPMHVT